MENVLQESEFAYLCLYCSVSCGSQKLLEEHIAELHRGYKGFKCANCPLSFDKEEDVLKHIESCNEALRLKSLKFASTSSEQKLSDTEEKLLKCEHCSWSFEQKSSLAKHVKLRHSDPPKKDNGKVPCPLCNSYFPSKSKLDRHYGGVHLKLRPYECRECKIKFSQRATLNKHNKDHHKQGKRTANLSESLPVLMPDSSDQESSEAREEQPLIPAEPEVNLSVSPLKLIVPPKLKLKLQSPSVPKEERQNGLHKDLSFSSSSSSTSSSKGSTVNVCHLCTKNFSQRSSLNRHLRCVHSIDTNKMKDRHRTPVAAETDCFNESHKCFVCDVSFSKLSDLENHNTDLHSGLVLNKEMSLIDERNDLPHPSVLVVHKNVPEAIATEEVVQEDHEVYNNSYGGVETATLFPPRHTEAAMELRGRTDISSETATVAESLLSLPESVLPFSSHPKDDVFNMRADEEDENIGADLKQRINELSMALEESDALTMPSNSLVLDERSLPNLSPSKRFSSTDPPPDEPLRKKPRRGTLSTRPDDCMLPKLRSKRASLPNDVFGNEKQSADARSRSKLPKREIYYNENTSSIGDESKPEDFVEGTFRCMECYTFFYCKKEFESHMEENHRDIRPFKCSKCHSSFKSEKAIEIHDAAVHEKLKPHICPKCNTGFGQKASLYRHIKEVNHDLIYCSDCNACFNVKRDLADHINSEHSVLKPFKCDHCDRSFVSKHQRHIHHLTVHEKRRPYKCEQCGAAFGQRGSLHRHMKTVDHKFLPHKCTQCVRAFRKEEDLQTHINTVHSGKYETPETSTRLRPFKCSNCKSSFKHEKMLQDHMQSCLGEEKEPSFACSFCNQTFDQEPLMTAHMISRHSNHRENVNQCVDCKTVFKKKKQLKKHIDYVKEHTEELQCGSCKHLFCLKEHLAVHVRDAHPEPPRPSIKEENGVLDSVCSNNIFESLDYASALGVKQNLEQIVDSIKKHSPKKAVETAVMVESMSHPLTTDANIISGDPINNIENTRNMEVVNHFSPIVKQEYGDHSQGSVNNNTYDKYMDDSPSNSQYNHSDSPVIDNSSSISHSKFVNVKNRFESSTLDKQYTRVVQNDVQYAVGVNPISYGDAPLHRDTFETGHYSKNFLDHSTNKPIDATSKTFNDDNYDVVSSQCNDNITYVHPKQKALTAPYKTFNQGHTQQHLSYERKHYDQSHYIVPTTDISMHENLDADKSCSSIHFASPIAASMAHHQHNNGSLKSFVTDHQRNSIVQNNDYTDNLHCKKNADDSTKTFVSTADYINNGTEVENSMKYVDPLCKEEHKSFVVTEEGNYIHSDELKYVEAMDLNNKSYHHHHDDLGSHVNSKYVQDLQKPLDATSKTFLTTDFPIHPPIKYVDANTSNGTEVSLVPSDQSIKYVTKVDGNSKPYSEYLFASHDINEAVKYVESAKNVEAKPAMIEKSEYYVPVTIGQMQYLVKHVDDQPFGGENLTYVNVDDLKEHSKMSSMETLYAVALDDVKDLEEHEGGDRGVNGVTPGQQSYAVIIDDTREKIVDGGKTPETGAKNYALTLHLVEALEKHVNKNVGDVTKHPMDIDNIKTYVTQNYAHLAGAGPSSEDGHVAKERIIFENNVPYISDSNGVEGTSGSVVKAIDATVLNKEMKSKLNHDNLVAVRDAANSEHYYMHSYVCMECNSFFNNKESLNSHLQTSHPN